MLMLIVLLALDKVNGVLCQLMLLLLLVNFIHGVIEAQHVTLSAGCIYNLLLLPHILSLDHLHGQLIQNADVLVLDLAVRRLRHMILLVSSCSCFKYDVLSTESNPLVLQ
jgi:hypothetical protein